jgi:hypothetical protein
MAYVYLLSALAAVPTSTAPMPDLPVDLRYTLGGLFCECPRASCLVAPSIILSTGLAVV